MKNIIPLFSMIMLTYSSCKEIDKLTHFYMDYTSAITIESSINIDIPFDVWTPEISTNSEETFQNKNTRTDLIEEIILTEMDMNTTSPEFQSFDFLKSVEVYIIAEGVEELKIAWYDDIPQTGLLTISLQTTDDNLEEYINKDKYRLRSRIVTRQLISASIEIEISNTFFVDAKLLGI